MASVSFMLTLENAVNPAMLRTGSRRFAFPIG